MQYFKKLGAGITTAALLVSAFAPGAMAADLEISGNGSDSNNTINSTHVCNSSVNQTSKTYAYVSVNASSNTGNNSADNNTGGNVTIDTGNATTNVTTTVVGGSNNATVPDCCDCLSSPATALISGNGSKSDNTINDTSVQNTSVTQLTRTRARVRVKKAKAQSGNNSASDNTGPGNVNVTTGNANTTVNTTVTGGNNTLP